jgi:A/G-specific adenine glycosylase
MPTPESHRAARSGRAFAALAAPLVAWYRESRRDLPWRRTRDPYRVWVSEVMLQQTTVRAVIPYYRRFLRRFPTLRALARARPGEVLAAWSGLGYYRRARSLHAAARLVVERHAGRLPRSAERLLGLPGIGRYTAGAILSIAFGLPEPILDGNVARVLSRLFALRRDPRSAAGRKRLWDLATALVRASGAPGDLNQALMEMGATVCTPAEPACPFCPLARRCAALAAGVQEAIPRPRRAKAPVVVRAAVALVARDGRYLVRRRAGTGLMDGLWEFPPLAARDGGEHDDRLRLRSLGRVATVRHSITYRRLVVDVHRARLLAEPRRGRYRWVTPRQVRDLPASSLVSKVLRSAGLPGRPAV